MDEYHETVKSRILLPRPSPDEIDACDISSLRIASIKIEARERAGDHGPSCPVSTSIGRPKRVLCPYIVLMKRDSNLSIPRDVPAACSEKGMVYLDSVLEQLGHFFLSSHYDLRLPEMEIRSLVHGRGSGFS
jgi:hypothetical protein